MRGRLILIEGLDRSGKSTQAEILANRLNGQLFKFPDRSTPIGEIINKFLTDPTFELSDESVHLLFSANRWEKAAQLNKLLSEGTHVIMDRYVYSGIAYSLAKDKSRDVEWLYGPDVGLPKPDLTFFLTVSMEELGTRKGWGEERYEKEQFQLKVKECFLKVLRVDTDPTIEIVDVNGLSIDETTLKLWSIIEARGLEGVTDDSLKTLA
ncbi:hypothetical protein PUMCH_002040 [Australozyma saopauloensis]|uniref:dTMP kinase n=1 Tax=Australozyma saopauloensis TaxID=291208 RepID=A0AAX4H8K2_9ASCO|nr:hypothetical protein PUMCH_002040 [[Candida] saopauloensis]